MSITKIEKKEIIKKFGSSEKDTGKTEVQIAILTTNITNLTKHIQEFPKDNSSKRGLYQMVSLRKKLLSYLKKTNIEGYRIIIQSLNIRG
ncbi:MAG: 30S ribosomal protein S15 [Mycoplasmataceae bacterium]|jgi:small subunit ribosomal protein S15|nr:30S ribosomal protein S15 [Mycoplasmataceae bacterium]